MLVFSRKKNESVIIQSAHGPIEVMITEVRGDKVKLGIQADPTIPVHRKEVWLQIHRAAEGTSENVA